MDIHVLQHFEVEGPGLIGPWAARHGHRLVVHPLYRGANLPEASSVSHVVVLGGPMNIYQEAEYPWLAAEKAWLKTVIAQGGSLLGICLGAQLLADCLGAVTTRNPQPEIGWFPLELSRRAQSHPFFRDWPASPLVIHWHGDTFALPEGALLLGSSEGCRHQGFLFGDRVVGLQFHLEWPPATAEALLAADYPADGGRYVQTPEAILAGPFAALSALLEPLLDGWAQAAVRVQAAS